MKKTLKHILSVCLVLLSLTLIFTSCVVSYEMHGFGDPTYSVNEDGKTCTITGMGVCMEAEVIIPKKIDGYTVTGIDHGAFYLCSALTSITIPDSVTSISVGAFLGCTDLTSITVEDGNPVYHSSGNCLIETESKTLIAGCNTSVIPDDGSVTSIGDSAFVAFISLIVDMIPNNATPFTSITIPDSVTSIGEYAFDGCYALTSITIPDGVTSIGDGAFRSCTSLTSITVEDGNSVYHSSGNCLIETGSKTLIAGCSTSVIPDDGSVTSIGDDAFEGCSSLASITIPDNVTSIGGSAFEGCTSLTSITIPDSVTSIGDSAFRKCTSLTSITIPDNVTSIGGSAFEGCTSLTSITIPDSVTSIGGSAFEWCQSLTSINMPDSVTSIGKYAFDGCYALTSITIPNGVTSIGDGAFRSCTSLTSITVEDGNSVYHSSGNCLIETGSKTLIAGCITSVIPDDGSVTSIGDDAFDGCSSLESITIPDSVTSIGIGAFSGCMALTSISYAGTINQWNAISKGDGWNRYAGDYVIHCIDGDI